MHSTDQHRLLFVNVVESDVAHKVISLSLKAVQIDYVVSFLTDYMCTVLVLSLVHMSHHMLLHSRKLRDFVSVCMH